MTNLDAPPPFVGPRPFLLSDQTIFFGRDLEIDTLFNRVLAYQVTVLFSRSGFGKSSLVEAGLRPRLERSGWLVLPTARVRGRFAPELTPNPFVRITLDDYWAGASPNAMAEENSTIPQFIAGLTPLHADILAVFDQFEEFFQSGTSRQRLDFLDQLRDAITSVPSLRLLITIREEFLADFESAEWRLVGRSKSRMRLERLNREAAADALRGPLARVGITIQDDAMAALLDSLTREQIRTTAGATEEVAGEFAEPVYLQIVANQLWRTLTADAKVVTLAHVRGLESQDPLSTYYQSSVEVVSQQTGVRFSTIVKWCSDVLVTADGTRALVYRGTDKTGSMPNPVIDALQQRHLVRAEMRAGAVWLELAHDQFVRPVIAAQAAWDARMAGPLARVRAWEAAAREYRLVGDRRKVLGPAEAVEAENLLSGDAAADLPITQELRDFIVLSREKNRRASRAVRQLSLQLVAALALLIGAISFGWWAWEQKGRGDRLNEQAIADRDRANSETARATRQAERADVQAAAATRSADELTEKKRQLEGVAADLSKQKTQLQRTATQLQTRTEDLVRTQRLYTLSELKNKVREASRPLPFLNDQIALKLADLAAHISELGEKSLSKDAQAAIRFALPVVREARPVSPGRRRRVTAQGSRAVEVSGSLALIYSIPDGELLRTIDLRPWLPVRPDPNNTRLAFNDEPSVLFNEDATRAEIVIGAQIVVLDIAHEAAPLFEYRPVNNDDGRRTWNVDRRATRVVAHAGRDFTVSDVDSRRELGRFSFEGEFIGFSNDGTHLFLWDRQRAISVADAPFTSVRLLWTSLAEIRDVAVLNNSVAALLKMNQGLVMIDSSGSRKMLRTPSVSDAFDISSHPTEPVLLVVGSIPGNRSAPVGQLYDIELIRADTDESVQRINSVELSERPFLLKDGRVVSLDRGNRIQVWARSGSLIKTLVLDGSVEPAVSVSDAGSLGVVSADATFDVYERDSSRSDPKVFDHWTAKPMKFDVSAATNMLLSPARILVAYVTGPIKTGNPATGEVQRVWSPGGRVVRLAVNRDWTMFATADQTGSVKLWRFDADAPLYTIQAHRGAVTALTFDRDGSRLATVGADRQMKLVATATGAVLRDTTVPATVTCAAFYDRSVLVGDVEGNVLVWDPSSSATVSNRVHHAAGPIADIAVNAEDHRLAIATGDAIRVLDLHSSAETAVIDVYDSRVVRVAFDGDGRSVIGLDDRGAVRIDPLSVDALRADIKNAIRQPLTRQECLKFVPLIPDACPAK